MPPQLTTWYELQLLASHGCQGHDEKIEYGKRATIPTVWKMIFK